MKTFVIYNADTGDIFLTQTGDITFPTAVACTITEIPEGKDIVRVDIATEEVVFKDREKTSEERIAELEAQMATLAGMEV